MSQSIWTETTKKCSGCNKFKTFDRFPKATGRKNGIKGSCKECNNKTSKLNYSGKAKREYYNKNKSIINEKVACPNCKCIISRNGMSEHQKTTKCKMLSNTNTTPKYPYMYQLKSNKKNIKKFMKRYFLEKNVLCLSHIGITMNEILK